VFLDPSLGAAPGHHSTVARNYRRLLAGRRETLFCGNVSGQSDCSVFSYRLEDAFRTSRHQAAWAANPVFAHAARTIANRFRRNRRMLVGPSAANAKPLTEEAYARLFRTFGAGRSLVQVWSRLAVGHGDDVVSLGVDPAMLCALAAAKPLLANAAGPRLHLVFMYPEEDFAVGAAEAPYWAIARDVAQAAFGVYTELDLHADALAGALGRKVDTQILPARLEPPQGCSCTEGFTVAVLGAGRWDKGFDALPAIAAATAERAGDIVFRIQGPAAGAGLEKAASMLAEMNNVTVLAPDLSEADYEAELARCHAALLAYDQRRYRRRNSAFLVDAQVAGRPIICTRGAALERAIAYGNGLSAETPQEFAAALVAMKAGYGEFLSAAQSRSRDFIAELRNGPLLRALEDPP
jgi:glycosyltransferase involved in cell wall biosynthesis